MFIRVYLCSFLAFMVSLRALALQPDELALIVNKQSPVRRQLAEEYSKARSVPADRIIELDLPTTDEISFEQYERDVVPPIRTALRQRNLEDKVKCLVTFYGVPLRIAAHHLSTQEKAEVAQIKTTLADLTKQIDEQVSSIESMAGQLDPSFLPSKGTSIEQLSQRVNAAAQALMTYAMRTSDTSMREQLTQRLGNFMQMMNGKVGFYERVAPSMNRRPLVGKTKENWQKLADDVEHVKRDLPALQDQRFDPDARAKLRDLVRRNFGYMGFAQQLSGMLDYFGETENLSAVDSELSLLWVNFYPRSKWVANQLNYKLPHPPIAHVLMVSRLDAPTPQIVSRIIKDSIDIELQGLHGQIVCDSRGKVETKPATDGYAEYDQTIRNLAQLVSQKSNLKLTADDSPQILPPHSAKDVALYIGWYKLHDYQPSCDFARGAIGIHVASLEMITLHGQDDPGWCRGLLKDGCVATLGAVAEPYLASFPAADDFFPLIMSGKLTLAEAYWRTAPMASWRIVLVGDPLYTPYKTNPAIAELPSRLQPALKMPPTFPGAK